MNALKMFVVFVLVAVNLVTLAADGDLVRDENLRRNLNGGKIIDVLKKPEYPTCGDCWCIPIDGGACPFERQPDTSNFPILIPTLRGFGYQNPISLDCDPHVERDTCDTSPPLESGGACVVNVQPSDPAIFTGEVRRCPLGWTYTLETYAGSFEEAIADGLLVTHAGACGVCSSLQDLAAYMEQGEELAITARKCALKGLVSDRAGYKCFLDLGFTEFCAREWFYNARYTADTCSAICFEQFLKREPNNGPAPECKLSECLDCDEVNAGPEFQKFAGRTRRSSGLQSGIVRSCDDVIDLEQVDPCSISIPAPNATG